MEDVIPLLKEEALLSILIEQSPTLIIKVETAEVREIEEEEGSGSTLRKDDNEGGDADNDDRIEDSPKNILSRKHNPGPKQVLI